MNITDREFWTLVHGMGFGALFLLAFAGGLAGVLAELLIRSILRENTSVHLVTDHQPWQTIQS